MPEPEPFFRKAGSGPGVVCIHSNASTSGQWRGLLELLAPKFHVLALDSYGSGKSPEWPSDRVISLITHPEPVNEAIALRRTALIGPDVNKIRLALPEDIPACVVLRGVTRENAISAERLTAMRITVQSWADDVRLGVLTGHVCTDDDMIVGYYCGGTTSGEVVELAPLPAHEGRGIGQRLLGRVIAHLGEAGHKRLFLGCAADPATRSFGFYRHLGWVSTGTFDQAGDEILELFTPAPS